MDESKIMRFDLMNSNVLILSRVYVCCELFQVKPKYFWTDLFFFFFLRILSCGIVKAESQAAIQKFKHLIVRDTQCGLCAADAFERKSGGETQKPSRGDGRE